MLIKSNTIVIDENNEKSIINQNALAAAREYNT
jgi:hypothetical protein